MAPPKPRKGTKSHTMGFPVFAIAFAPKKPRLVVGGGGGASKSGVKNSVIVYELNESTLDINMMASYYMSPIDDSCQSIAVHPKEKTIVIGANSSEELIEKKMNANCRIFTLKENKLLLQTAFKTVEGTDLTYQRVVRFSLDGKMLVTGCTDGVLQVWLWPEITPAIPAISFGGEVYDAHFDAKTSHVVGVSSQKLMVVNLSKGNTVWTTEKPTVAGETCEFRAARFGSGDSDGFLFTIQNAKSRKKSFVCKYSVGSWKLEKTKLVALRPVTAFTISDNGELLGLGAADASVSVLSAKTLEVRTIMRFIVSV
ncbi:hypothetical protein HDU76_011222 [Blyttiomyces sp. JEL0837]|nr:hypothetical protein HDU76_011222 [Blyttiomyces sp. JEL0837]